MRNDAGCNPATILDDWVSPCRSARSSGMPPVPRRGGVALHGNAVRIHHDDIEGLVRQGGGSRRIVLELPLCRAGRVAAYYRGSRAHLYDDKARRPERKRARAGHFTIRKRWRASISHHCSFPTSCQSRPRSRLEQIGVGALGGVRLPDDTRTDIRAPSAPDGASGSNGCCRDRPRPGLAGNRSDDLPQRAARRLTSAVPARRIARASSITQT